MQAGTGDCKADYREKKRCPVVGCFQILLPDFPDHSVMTQIKEGPQLQSMSFYGVHSPKVKKLGTPTLKKK